MLAGRSIMRMRWRHLLFAHWPIDAQALRTLVPPQLEIDEFDGRAWVGLIPFTMEDFSPRRIPRLPWRGVTDFHECNVRTYVYPRGMKDDPAAHGVWFFSLDAASRLAVWGARRFFHLPYFNARMSLQREGDVIDYSVARLSLSPWERDGVRACHGQARQILSTSTLPSPPPSPKPPSMHCRWRALESLPASRPGDLAHFLTERYCLYAMRGQTLYRGRVEHDPWPLRAADLLSLDDSLILAAGIDLDHSREPVLYHADVLNVRAWWLERV